MGSAFFYPLVKVGVVYAIHFLPGRRAVAASRSPE